MKLHCSKILLFLLPLNILVTSLSNVHNKNKPYITQHTPTTTSRLLSEKDTQSLNYDNDAEMKSMKEIFNRQTSQRFEEYEERIQEKRQKRKEQRDKNIQKIIEKDKMEKSLAEKVEKGCLRCGCGLGGVAASVGLFGGLGIYGWKTAATATAMAEGAVKSVAAAEAARIAAGIKAVISGIEREFSVSTVGVQGLQSLFTAQNYNNVINIARAINSEYKASSCLISGPVTDKSICPWVMRNFVSQGNSGSTYKSIEIGVTSIVSKAETVAETAAKKATEEAIKASTDAVESAYAACQTAIIASVVAILVIVLVMVIIFLILRYRRKKKLNEKQQYTKLLNQ
ncbi:surface antigen [Plasmodium falciparum UGT5.1]|uniref:Surface antigen n=1 Tax=Plasmodium falciparum UGT5.1 TaxID=1237627 RepID=W7J4L0_PLAFA|nr:surface antigen [Plasmodium falciparum UGT5.1]